MGMDLYFYSKNRIEKVSGEPIENFLTNEGFYKSSNKQIKFYDVCDCYIGRSNCIDEDICGSEMWDDFNENTLYTNGDCFDKKVKFYDKSILETLFEKIKSKMIEYRLNNDDELTHLDHNYIFPYYSNVVNCLNWLNELEKNDKIILIAI